MELLVTISHCVLLPHVRPFSPIRTHSFAYLFSSKNKIATQRHTLAHEAPNPAPMCPVLLTRGAQTSLEKNTPEEKKKTYLDIGI